MGPRATNVLDFFLTSDRALFHHAHDRSLPHHGARGELLGILPGDPLGGMSAPGMERCHDIVRTLAGEHATLLPMEQRTPWRRIGALALLIALDLACFDTFEPSPTVTTTGRPAASTGPNATPTPMKTRSWPP